MFRRFIFWYSEEIVKFQPDSSRSKGSFEMSEGRRPRLLASFVSRRRSDLLWDGRGGGGGGGGGGHGRVITAMKREEGQKRRDIVLLQWTTSITHMPEEDEGEERERTKKGGRIREIRGGNMGKVRDVMSPFSLDRRNTLSDFTQDRSVRRVTRNHLALSTALLTNLSHPFPDI